MKEVQQKFTYIYHYAITPQSVTIAENYDQDLVLIGNTKKKIARSRTHLKIGLIYLKIKPGLTANREHSKEKDS